MTKESWIPVSGLQEVPADGATKLVLIDDNNNPQLLWYTGQNKDIPIIGGCFIHDFIRPPKITHYLTIVLP
jgi:hypothetical protein